MTYSYYHSTVKGKAPKNAPTYRKEETKVADTTAKTQVITFNYLGFYFMYVPVSITLFRSQTVFILARSYFRKRPFRFCDAKLGTFCESTKRYRDFFENIFQHEQQTADIQQL